MQIQIKPTHIKKGIPYCADKCPITLAIQEQGFTKVLTGKQGISIDNENYEMDEQTKDWIKEFDNMYSENPINIKIDKINNLIHYIECTSKEFIYAEGFIEEEIYILQREILNDETLSDNEIHIQHTTNNKINPSKIVAIINRLIPENARTMYTNKNLHKWIKESIKLKENMNNEQTDSITLAHINKGKENDTKFTGTEYELCYNWNKITAEIAKERRYSSTCGIGNM